MFICTVCSNPLQEAAVCYGIVNSHDRVTLSCTNCPEVFIRKDNLVRHNHEKHHKYFLITIIIHYINKFGLKIIVVKNSLSLFYYSYLYNISSITNNTRVNFFIHNMFSALNFTMTTQKRLYISCEIDGNEILYIIISRHRI